MSRTGPALVRAAIRIVVALLLGGTVVVAAALEVNEATRAQLEQLRGLGVETTERILAERARGAFVDWDDLGRRVKGLRGKRAAALAEQGLTVAGRPHPGRNEAERRAPGPPAQER